MKHIRRVWFIVAMNGYRSMTIEEQLRHGPIETWCGERVEPTEENRIFVDIDGVLDRMCEGDRASEACSACRMAIAKALAP